MSQFHPAIRSTETAELLFEPETEKMQGLPRTAVWAAMIVAPWAAIYGVMTLWL